MDVLFSELEKHLQTINYELIFVDDFSKDDSWNKLNELKTRYQSSVKLILLNKNYGQHIALMCGFHFAKGDYIITMDGDMQHPPSEIKHLIEKQQQTQAEVVYGYYEEKKHSAVRNTLSYFARKSAVIAASYSGKGSSFRLITKEISQKIVENHNNEFLFIDEVLNWYTTSFAYATVKHNERTKDNSSYSFIKLLRLYFNIVTNYYASPLKLITWLGLFFSFITFALGARFLIRKFFYGVPIGFTAIIVSILFSTSIILLVLGIIGQYIFKIFTQHQNKPVFQIKSVVE